MLCGYARLPDAHPWEGLHFSDEAPSPRLPDPDATPQELMDGYGAVPVGLAIIFDDPQALREHARTVARRLHIHEDEALAVIVAFGIRAMTDEGLIAGRATRPSSRAELLRELQIMLTQELDGV